MTYKAKVAVFSEILTKHSTQSEHRVEFLNIQPGGKGKRSKVLPVRDHEGSEGE